MSEAIKMQTIEAIKPQTYINQLSQHVGEDVVLKGWLYNLRSSGKLMFPQLRDGTGVVQCVVVKSAVAPEVWEALKPLGQESALIIYGRVREDARAPSGVEVDVTNAEVLQNVRQPVVARVALGGHAQEALPVLRE